MSFGVRKPHQRRTPKRTRKKPVFRYEIVVPVREILIMEVYATSKKEALALIRSCDASVSQTCSIAGRRKFCRRFERIK